MNKKNKIILTVVLLLFVVIILGISAYVYFDYNRYNHEEELKQEINTVISKDYTTDTFLVDTKTKGKYQEIEKTAKEYMQKYTNSLQALLNVASDEQFTQILSIDNYKQDAKDFKKTKSYIETTKKTLTDNYNVVKTMSDKDNILKQIDSKKLDKYYTDLYKEIMGNEQFISKMQQTNSMASKNYNMMLSLLEASEHVIDFLIKNKNKWEIKNNLVEFENDTLLKEYNKLVEDVKSVTK